MDTLLPTMILLAGMTLVAGTILVVFFMEAPDYPRLLRTRKKASTGRRRVAPASVICPREGAAAIVRLGVEPADSEGDPGRLTVLRCERFGNGVVTCDMACLDQEIFGEPAAA